MATNSIRVGKRTVKKADSRYAGWSAVTGKHVLKPTSKGGTITLEQARAAWRQVFDNK